MFQHTAARRRLAGQRNHAAVMAVFQHTAARRRLGEKGYDLTIDTQSFNTQPPEGGWSCWRCNSCFFRYGFNTQPPEGGWLYRRTE